MHSCFIYICFLYEEQTLTNENENYIAISYWQQPRANTLSYIVNVAETISNIQSLNMPLYVAIIKALWDRLSEVSTALSTTTVSNLIFDLCF